VIPSDDVVVEVGESATVTFTLVEDGQNPNICSPDENGEFHSSAGNAYVLGCPPSGATVSYTVTPQSPGRTTVYLANVGFYTGSGVYRTESIEQVIVVTAVPVPIVAVTGVTDGGVYREDQVTPGCDVTNLREGTTVPSPVISGATGPYPQTRTATCTYQAGTSPAHTATVTYTITGPNAGPVITGGDSIAVTTAEDTPITISTEATDADGDSLTYTVTAGPEHGTLTTSGATQVYSPAANYNGPDSYSVLVSDGFGGTASTVVSITVTPVNDAPVIDDATAQNRVIPATSSAGAVFVPGVTATDADGTTPTVTCNPAAGSTLPRGTTMATCIASDGVLTDTATFTVQVLDAAGPVIRLIGGPQPNVTYTQGSVPAIPVCDTSGSVSVVTQCTITGYSTTVGRHTMTVRARDTTGNATVVTRSYTVVAGGTTPTNTPTRVPTGTVVAVPTATSTATPTTPVVTPTTRPERTPTTAPTQPPTTTPAPTRPPRR
jgi:hypothetical protein